MTTFEMKRELDNYSAEELLQIGLPDMTFYKNGARLDALCPFHDDHKLGNFSYNLGKNCWRCFVCDESGSGPYSLIMAVKGQSFAEVVRYLYENRGSCVGKITEAPPSALLRRGKKLKMIKPVAAPILVDDNNVFDPNPTAEAKSLVYSCFAAASPLSDGWKENLQSRRGVCLAELPCFFRFPANKDKEFWTRFQRKLKEEGAERLASRLLGIPGFFWDIKKEQVAFMGFSGSLGILNHDEAGLVSSIEMRLPDSWAQTSRYLPFSSEGLCDNHPDDYRYGAKVGAIVDVVPPPVKGAPIRGVAVTEGKFKALHLSRMGYLALNIRGVGNWRSVFPTLEQLEENGVSTSRVFITFDADSRCNPPVAEHSASFGQRLMDEGYETYYLTWPSTCGKGVDDVVLAGQQGKIRTVEGERFLKTTLLPFIERAKKRKVQTGT